MEDEMRKIHAEVQLLNWSETATGGSKVVLQVDDLDPWRLLQRKEGKTAGTRFMAVFVEIGDDEQPVQEEPATINNAQGPLCQWAVMRSREPAFQQFMEQFDGSACAESMPTEEMCKQLVLQVCGISSRKELDSNPIAARIFRERIMLPWAASHLNPYRNLNA
jgi:hypothetical protein